MLSMHTEELFILLIKQARGTYTYADSVLYLPGLLIHEDGGSKITESELRHLDTSYHYPPVLL